MGQRHSGRWWNALLVLSVATGLTACAQVRGVKENPPRVQDRTRTIHLPATVSLPAEADQPRAGSGQKGGFKIDLAGAVRRAVEREIVQRGLFSIVPATTPADADLMLSVTNYGVGETQAGTYYASLDVTATLLQGDKSALWTNRKTVWTSDRYKAGERTPLGPPDTSTVLQAGLDRASARVATELFEDFDSLRAAAPSNSGETSPRSSSEPEKPRTRVLEKAFLGKLSYHVETLAKDANCQGPDGQRPAAALIGKAPGLEVYSIGCADKEAMLVRCEYQFCSIISDSALAASVHDQSQPVP